MKIATLVGLGALLAAVGMNSAFAQTSRPYDPSGPKTRAQVKADLATIRSTGSTIRRMRNARAALSPRGARSKRAGARRSKQQAVSSLS
jgi:hypothetical protein